MSKTERMKLAFSILLMLATFLVSCSEHDPVGLPSEEKVPGTVVVFVHWDGQGLEDMRVELVELAIELETDREGLAEFLVPAGRYTLRAYDINQGGPALDHVDTEIVVQPNKTVWIEIVNCLPCV
jgi:hypothetical protein